MENIILTNNKDLRLVSVKVGVLSTLRFELPLVSASATHVEVIVTSGNVPSAYTATFIDATKSWQCDIAASQFPTVGRQSYEVAYVLDGKQFWDGKGWIEIENATTSGIEPQPRPEPYRYVVVSVNGYGADAQGAVRIPKTFIAINSPTTTEGFIEGDIYFNRETGATWTLCNVQSTLTWVFNYKNYYTKAETEEAIDRVAAYYITYDAAGNPFPTYAALANATTVYSGGVVRVPTRNDYCVVLADETHQGAEYRYIYAVAEGATTGSWQAQFPVEGVMTVDQTVIKNSINPVAGGGVWSAIWGTATTAFSSIYDWVVNKLSEYRHKLDLAVYGFGNATVALPDGFSITYYDETYTAPVGGETITFIGPVPSSNPNVPNNKFYYPSNLGTLDSFDPNNYSVWCLVCLSGGDTPDMLMYKTGPSYSISGWNSAAPTLTLSNGEATGDAPTMARPIGATGDTLVKMSQMNTALAGKASTADATLTPIYSQTPTFSSWQFRASSGIFLLEPSVSYSSGTWTFYMSDEARATCEGDWDAVSLEFNLTSYVVTATRTDIIGYILGPDDSSNPNIDKPLASEAEAEALRTALAGKQDALSAQQLANIAAVPNKADVSAIPYSLVTQPIVNNAVLLEDRASNSVTISATLSPNTLTVNFLPALIGKVRDFAMRLNIAAGVTAPEIVWPQGVTLENDGGEVPEIADGGTGGSSTILYFSETENDGTTAKFLVKGETLTAIAQA